MNPQENFYRQSNQGEKESRRETRQGKWEKQKQKFWKTFLFTEEGKPKSALWVYTFCLSFVLLGFHILSFGLLIDVLQPLAQYFSVFAGNLVLSLICSVAALMPGCLIHRFSGDKRLVFGGYLWLSLYAAAVLVTVVVMLWGDRGAVIRFLQFFAWFFLIPVLVGLTGSFLLYQKDNRKAGI